MELADQKQGDLRSCQDHVRKSKTAQILRCPCTGHINVVIKQSKGRISQTFMFLCQSMDFPFKLVCQMSNVKLKMD